MLRPPVSEQDHTRGAANAQVQILEFGDYQCPHCGIAEPYVEKIYQDFGSVVSISFRNFPLADMHEYAMPAACAAEAASLQGKFWEMHDLIFANQGRLSARLFIEIADSLGLDIQKFETDMNSETVINKIKNDFESGAKSGVNGTPSFYINGQKFEGGGDDLYRLIAENVS